MSTAMSHTDAMRAAGQLDAALDAYAHEDPRWVESFMALGEGTLHDGVLDPRLVELIGISINASVTHLHAPGVRRHIRNALKLGVTRAHIIEVLKLGAVVAIHAGAIAVPILAEELHDAGTAELSCAERPATPVTDHLRASGGFNPMWELLARWDPPWLERFIAMGSSAFASGVLPPLWVELLCIAGDAKVTHMYSPGTRRHIKAALALGATHAQIWQVLKIVSLQGIQAAELTLPILDEECRAAEAAARATP